MSPEAIQAALLEFGGRVECTHPEEAMERAIARALEVDGFTEERVGNCDGAGSVGSGGVRLERAETYRVRLVSRWRNAEHPLGGT